jgi:D-aminopeptidase
METRDRIMLAMKQLFTVVLLCALCAAGIAAQSARPRARDLGLRPGVLTPGPLNAITDVAGGGVGHTTLVSGDTIRTGVTAVVPHVGNVFQDKVPGAVFVGNAFGKLAGSTQVEELGTIETPIVLTNTLSVGAAIEGVVRWTLQQSGNEQVRSVNALVGETNDGGLNDIRALHVRPEHVVAAIAAARTGAVEEGSVGAGTGTRAFSWKGGIGTASRRLDARAGGFTVGVLVQSNYGGYLTMGGAPVGRELAPARPRQGNEHDGSCMIVVATDAPLDARDLKRLAARAIYGLARTGSSYSNGSGDFAIAFSTVGDLRVRFGETNAQARTVLPTDGVSNVFLAALEATEEAVYNSLLKATTVTSRSGSAEAIPIDRLTEVLRRYRAIE